MLVSKYVGRNIACILAGFPRADIDVYQVADFTVQDELDR